MSDYIKGQKVYHSDFDEIVTIQSGKDSMGFYMSEDDGGNLHEVHEDDLITFKEGECVYSRDTFRHGILKSIDEEDLTAFIDFGEDGSQWESLACLEPASDARSFYYRSESQTDLQIAPPSRDTETDSISSLLQ